MLKRLTLICCLLILSCPRIIADTPTHFFSVLRPKAEQANTEILITRSKLLSLHRRWQQGDIIPKSGQQWLAATADSYDLDTWQIDQANSWQTLINRVDIIPNAIILAQAAHESGFGRSRFAREGNSLFGQWCYSPGCGMVPNRRSAGKTHEVQRFDSKKDAILAYLHNLNTQKAYRHLRQIRAKLRKLGEPLCGTAMAAGLDQYSTQRQQYVTAIRRMIQRFKLDKANACQ